MIRILFAGSPEPAALTLKLLIEKSNENGFCVAGVLTNPPSAKGRHKELIPTPVAKTAMENSIPVFCPEHLNSDAREEIIPLNADLLVCFAYGHIFGPKFLSLFKFGGINLHPSLLPKYRGCTPVPAAILNRDKETAVTIQTLSLGMDEGEILAQEKITLSGNETTGSLLETAAVSGAKLICNVIEQINKTNLSPKGTAQEGEPSYTDIIKKEDGKINWNDSAEKIEAMIRAYTPDPGCFCEMELSGKTETLRILEAALVEQDKAPENYSTSENGKVVAYDKPTGILVKTASGILAVKKLQRQGKNPMFYKDFMNGVRDFVGTVLK